MEDHTSAKAYKDFATARERHRRLHQEFARAPVSDRPALQLALDAALEKWTKALERFVDCVVQELREQG